MTNACKTIENTFVISSHFVSLTVCRYKSNILDTRDSYKECSVNGAQERQFINIAPTYKITSSKKDVMVFSCIHVSCYYIQNYSHLCNVAENNTIERREINYTHNV